MDYDEILFGLNPLINITSADSDIPIENDLIINSYVTVLDQLAVCLRAPKNRDIIRESNLFNQLNRILELSLDELFKFPNIDNWCKLCSELIRCVANSLIDNNLNRKIWYNGKNNKFIKYYFNKILSLSFNSNNSNTNHDIYMRAIVLIRNFILEEHETDEYKKFCCKFIFKSLLKFLESIINVFREDEYNDVAILGFDLLDELIPYYNNNDDISTLLIVSKFLHKVAITTNSEEFESVNRLENDDNDDYEETISESLLKSTTNILESLLKNENIKFGTSLNVVSQINSALFSSLSHLELIFDLPSRLIILRRISTSLGLISANETNPNKQDVPFFIENINFCKAQSYTIFASMLCLSNSITARNDVNSILKHLSYHTIITKAKIFNDPWQYQGFLDLLKKMISIVNYPEDSTDISNMFKILLNAHTQCKFYPQLAPLLENLLNKLLAILPSSQLSKSTELSTIVLDKGGETCCLYIIKAFRNIQGPEVGNDDIKKYWNACFKVEQHGKIDIKYLFELLKAIGVYIRDFGDRSIFITDREFSNKLLTILYVINEQILENNDHDNSAAERAVLNNAKFVCGMVLNHADVNQTPDLIKVCNKFLKDLS
ncbi:uncharacterized protein SCODWIG_00850 [Saccharomycodes ludwigii]|uniref:Uncharacterized protein n=1 Tax=Saccharomycodes ludwigii TaxID=36035 RepID=A0A376B3C4_9ASCO|nr:uncharacterized protein SCODWIG_00850 [Saccharomycodes ludwigii]